MPVTSMAAQAEDHHKLTYRSNIELVTQQKKGLIRPLVTEAGADGEAMNAADLLGKSKANRGGSAMTNPQNKPLASRRWIARPDVVDIGDYITKEEYFDRAMDPKGKYVESFVAAVNRENDDICLGIVENDDGTFSVGDGGILGGALTGKTPSSSRTTLPNDCYTVHGSVGMTKGKLLEATERLKLDDFGMEDDDQLYAGITPHQVTDLLELADGDGSALNLFEQEQLRSGKPTPLLGLIWVVTNRLPLDADGKRMCPIWSKKNIALGIWQDVKGELWNDTHAKNLPYCYVSSYMDAVRIEDLGVHVIACQE